MEWGGILQNFSLTHLPLTVPRVYFTPPRTPHSLHFHPLFKYHLSPYIVLRSLPLRSLIFIPLGPCCIMLLRIANRISTCRGMKQCCYACNQARGISLQRLYYFLIISCCLDLNFLRFTRISTVLHYLSMYWCRNREDFHSLESLVNACLATPSERPTIDEIEVSRERCIYQYDIQYDMNRARCDL